MLASFPAQAFTQRWLKLGSSVAAKPCILANEKSEPRSVQPLSEADTPAYLTIKPVGADRILAQGRALLLAGAHDQKIVGNRWSPDGHPNSPTYGHPKFPHPGLGVRVV